MHILITGGAGFIGSKLSEQLLNDGHSVSSLDLYPSQVDGVHSITADLTKPLEQSYFTNVDGIVHLAGRSIFGRWNKQYKQSLWDSRVLAAEMMYDAIASLEVKPRFFFSASAIGYYGDRGSEVLDESSSKGTGFLSNLVQDWEEATIRFETLGLRTASFRHAHVLGKKGLIGTLLPFYRLGLGGPIGSGNYYLSWITVEDLVTIYRNAIEDSSIQGIYNAVSDKPILYKDFSNQLAKSLHRPHIFRIPKFIIQLLYSREFTKEITSSQRVVSTKEFIKSSSVDRTLGDVFKNLF